MLLGISSLELGMKKSILHLLFLGIIATGLQACGDMPTNEGFTETDISTPVSTAGIQEGLCEETETEFTFKSKDGAGQGVTFSAGTGIMIGPDGEEYILEESKNNIAAQSNSVYPCTMEVFENGNIEFVSLLKSAGDRKALVRGVAMVN